MNWYRKIADALVQTVDEGNVYDDNRQGSFLLDKGLFQKDVDKIEKSHPMLYNLGRPGSRGRAYQFGPPEEGSDDPAMKLTSDISEFEMAQKLIRLQKKMGGNIPGVVGVFYAKKITDRTIGNVYQIYLEKVKHLTHAEDSTIDFLCDVYRNILLNIERGLLDGGKAKDLPELVIDYVKNSDEVIGRIRSVVGGNMFEGIMGKFSVLVQKLGRIDPGGMSGIFWDLCAENVGIDQNGDYVLLDIGGLQL